MTKREFDVALFDIDGTVLNTTEFILQAYRYSIKRHLGEDVTWKEVSPVLGLPLDECYYQLTNLRKVKDLVDSHNEFQYQNLYLAIAYPNTLATLRVLKRAGVVIGAVTTRYGEQVEETLRLTSIRENFQTVITPLDIENPKPHAEPILKALENLGVTPQKAVMIGDSPIDILSGKNAGTKTIGALYGFHGQRLLEAEPDYVVNDISEIIPIILGGRH